MTPALPTWVRKRDGHLEPFEADRISRALFAASESCEQPDAFLARELADVVVHFLAEESEGTIPTTATVSEVVVKVLRELRQHALASHFEGFSQQKNRGSGTAPAAIFRDDPMDKPSAVRDACLRDYSLRAVFKRDLAAAHRDGLIVLGGLETPCAVQSALVEFGSGSLVGLRTLAATPCQVVVIESAEYAIASGLSESSSRDRVTAEKAARTFLEGLEVAARLTGRSIVVNLNGALPRSCGQASGPLFPGSQESETARWRGLATAVAEVALRSNDSPTQYLRFHWHLSERDFEESDRHQLAELARRALTSGRLTIVFDRPRLPILLAEGMSRPSSAVLLSVGLNLALLAQLPDQEVSVTTAAGSEFPTNATRFLGRLKSLARLALSAGVQKRAFFRRQAVDMQELGRGLLVERSSLLVVPMGLEAAATILGRESCDSRWTHEFGCAAMRELADVLREEGRAVGLETNLDASPDGTPGSGPTCWDETASVHEQLKAAGALHAAAGSGTASVLLPAELPTGEQAAEWLRWAWKNTGVRRVQFVRGRSQMIETGHARGLFRSEREM